MIKRDEYAKWLEAIEKFPNLRMSEADMSEIAGLIKSLRNVARAGQYAVDELGQLVGLGPLVASLHALPDWVLESEE